MVPNKPSEPQKAARAAKRGKPAPDRARSIVEEAERQAASERAAQKAAAEQKTMAGHGKGQKKAVSSSMSVGSPVSSALGLALQAREKSPRHMAGSPRPTEEVRGGAMGYVCAGERVPHDAPAPHSQASACPEHRQMLTAPTCQWPHPSALSPNVLIPAPSRSPETPSGS